MKCLQGFVKGINHCKLCFQKASSCGQSDEDSNNILIALETFCVQLEKLLEKLRSKNTVQFKKTKQKNTHDFILQFTRAVCFNPWMNCSFILNCKSLVDSTINPFCYMHKSICPKPLALVDSTTTLSQFDRWPWWIRPLSIDLTSKLLFSIVKHLLPFVCKQNETTIFKY